MQDISFKHYLKLVSFFFFLEFRPLEADQEVEGVKEPPENTGN